MSEVIRAWFWLIACAGAWLAVVLSAAEADWSCEVMFAASLVALALLRFVSRHWAVERATTTAKGGVSLFRKLALVSIPFVVLSTLVRWKFDSELLDWVVARIIWLQAFAANIHAERRWGYVASGVSLFFAMLIIYFGVARKFEAIDAAASSQKKVKSILGTASALIAALTTFSIVVGPASASLSHISERQASAMLEKLSNEIARGDSAWRVILGKNLASVIEDEPINETLSPDDSVNSSDCEATAPEASNCTLGMYLDGVFSDEGLRPILASDIITLPSNGRPPGGDGSNPFASGLYRAAGAYKAIRVPHSIARSVDFQSVLDLKAGDIIEAVGKFCEVAACDPDRNNGAAALAEASRPDVTKTRFGKVLGAVFDVVLPLFGTTIPAPKISDEMAPVFQDVVNSVTKNPLKETMRDLSTRGINFLVRHCIGEQACDFETPLREELRNSVRQTPGWKDRLVTALKERWVSINPPPVSTTAFPAVPDSPESSPLANGMCQCVTTRNGVVVNRQVGECKILSLTCH